MGTAAVDAVMLETVCGGDQGEAASHGAGNWEKKKKRLNDNKATQIFLRTTPPPTPTLGLYI